MKRREVIEAFKFIKTIWAGAGCENSIIKGLPLLELPVDGQMQEEGHKRLYQASITLTTAITVMNNMVLDLSDEAGCIADPFGIQGVFG